MMILPAMLVRKCRYEYYRLLKPSLRDGAVPHSYGRILQCSLRPTAGISECDRLSAIRHALYDLNWRQDVRQVTNSWKS